MKINQFSIIPTSSKQQQQELMMLHLLKANEATDLTPTALWETLLVRLHLGTDQPITSQQWFHDLLATPELAIDEWLTSQQPLTDQVFYLVALQLLEFEPGVDFEISDPRAAVNHLNLPHHFHPSWTTDDVIGAIYLLLNTFTKNGQLFIDALTANGFLAWSYDLPADQKPLYFNGKPLASFDPTKLIREVVYVETDLDTDFDGQADLVKVEIMRPIDSNHGLKVPAIFTASPYNQGTNDKWGEKLTHNVNLPLTHKELDYQAPQEVKFPTKVTHRQVTGHCYQASESFSNTAEYTLNNYLAVRGYAIVYAAGIGTKDSDGLQTCGSPEQTDSMKAVVEWLHGDRRAFIDRQSGTEITADWCNGNVAMTGRSYLGTLATAVATTGVAGLKAIISEAAISSWYDYYRENGLVRAAGGFQGEDADTLAAETFSRTKRPADYRRIEATNHRYLKQMAAAMDRKSGNYNDFWDQRNYRKDISKIKAAVMMVHGLNDTNVRPSNVKALFDGLQKLPVEIKLILHQGQHIYINAFSSLDFSAMVNLWLANKLWEQINNADQVLPPVLVQANHTPETWTPYQSWTAGHQQSFNLNSQQLATKAGTGTMTFNDQQPQATYQTWCKHPAKWANALIHDQGQFSCHFKTAPIEQDILLRGTPSLTVRIASSLDHGMVSARLVDFGEAKRLTTSPVIINQRGLQLGYHWKTDDLREFQFQQTSSTFKVISSGHINLQNRHNPAQVDQLRPGEFLTVKFGLQPLFHRLVQGHQLGLIIYSTDYEYTLRGNEAITYQLDLAGCQLSLPGWQPARS